MTLSTERLELQEVHQEVECDYCWGQPSCPSLASWTCVWNQTGPRSDRQGQGQGRTSHRRHVLALHKPSLSWCKACVEQDCPQADRKWSLYRPPRLSQERTQGTSVQLFDTAWCSPSLHVSQEHGLARAVLYHEHAQEAPTSQHLSVCVACKTVQLLHCATTLLFPWTYLLPRLI